MLLKPNHSSVDLETMGKKPGYAIVSIGAVIFDPRGNIMTTNTFYAEIDWEEQPERYGLRICPETRDWWEGLPSKARQALNGIDSLEDVLKDFAAWLPRDCTVWGNDSVFDIGFLEVAYEACGLPTPWAYYRRACAKTLKLMYECRRGGINLQVGPGAHTALEDAVYQADQINKMWRVVMNNGEVK